jgi:carboxymethylenebutenolidase
VVFIHDVWGPSPHSQQFSDRLADAGYVVLAVDFYRDLAEAPGADPGAFIRGLSDPDVLADVARGIAALEARDDVVTGRIGVTGVCMGGMYALLAACSIDGLAAAAPFYGMLSYDHGMLAEPGGRDHSRKPRAPLEAAPGLRCPLLAFFGEQDAFIPGRDVDALEAALPKDAQAVEIVRYADAGHAFMNETREEVFRAEAARDAWSRLEAFFDRHLRGDA